MSIENFQNLNTSCCKTQNSPHIRIIKSSLTIINDQIIQGNFILHKLLLSILVSTSITSQCQATEKPNAAMLKRIGINANLECAKPPFAVAVVDSGKIYEHPSLNPNVITPRPLPFPEKRLQTLDEHGLNVCSVIHQLHPLTEIFYYCSDNDNSGELSIRSALENENVKIINCSFSTYSYGREIFVEAQKQSKLLIFSASNCNGWLGLNARNRFFTALAKDPQTKKSFALVGGSETKNNQEEISLSFLRAGALRNHFLIGPGVNVPVFSHNPDLKSIKLVDGTSFSAPHINAAILYLTTFDPNLTPYKAWRQLCKTANTPLVLSHASIGDQGWGYLNLGRALSCLNLKTNLLANSEFTNIYDSHMQRLFLHHSSDVVQNEYPIEIIENLRKQDADDVHVKQLLRVALFERGVFLLASNLISDAITCFEEAKDLGINHEDPLASLTVKKDIMIEKLNKEEQNQKWHQGMIIASHAWRSSNSQKKEDLNLQPFKQAYDYGYEGATSLIASQLSLKILRSRPENAHLLKSFIKDYEKYPFSEKEKDDICHAFVGHAKLVIEKDLNIALIKEIIELMNPFHVQGKTNHAVYVSLYLTQMGETLITKNCFDDKCKSIIQLISDISLITKEDMFLKTIESTLALKLSDKTADPVLVMEMMNNMPIHTDVFYCSLSNYHFGLAFDLLENQTANLAEEIIQNYDKALHLAHEIKGEMRDSYLSNTYGELGCYYLTLYKNNPEHFQLPVLAKAILNLEEANKLETKWLVPLIDAKARQFKANSFFASWF